MVKYSARYSSFASVLQLATSGLLSALVLRLGFFANVPGTTLRSSFFGQVEVAPVLLEFLSDKFGPALFGPLCRTL